MCVSALVHTKVRIKHLRYDGNSCSMFFNVVAVVGVVGVVSVAVNKIILLLLLQLCSFLTMLEYINVG